MIAPFQQLNGGQHGVETTDVDYPRVVFHHGPFAYVVALVTVRGVVRVCAFQIDFQFEFELGFVDCVAD